MAVSGGVWPLSDAHQRVMDGHEILADNLEPAFRKKKMDISNAAMLRILDRNNRAASFTGLYLLQRVFKAKAGQRQMLGASFHRRTMRIRTRRALEGNRVIGISRGRFAHFFNHSEGRGGKTVHVVAAIARRTLRQAYCAACNR